MIARALKNTGWLMGARGVNAVLSLVYLALATRALGLADFGQFVLIFTFAQLVVGFASFQTWQVVIRWGQVEQLRDRAIGFALSLDLVTILVGGFGAAALLIFAGDWLPVDAQYRDTTLAFTLVYLLCIRSTPTGILRLHDRYAKAAGADATLSIVRVIGATGASIWAPNIDAFLIIWAISEAATAALHWWLASRAQPIAWRAISLFHLPQCEHKVWHFVAGVSLTASLSLVSRQLVVLLIGALGGAAMAGIYRVAAQLGEGVLKLAQAVLRAVYPELVRDPKIAAKIARKMTTIALATALIAVVISVLAGEWLVLAIAGEEFVIAYWPLVLLAAAAAIELAGASLEALILARGQALTIFFLRLAPTALALVPLPWLIADFGAAGAAFAVFTASLLTVCGFALVAFRMRETTGQEE